MTDLEIENAKLKATVAAQEARIKYLERKYSEMRSELWKQRGAVAGVRNG